MNLYIGTSGFSYKEWKGSFYPEDLRPQEMLRYYAEHLTAVEINNTFYRMPSEKLLVGWAGQVPDGFSFVLKVSRRITHQKRLRDAESELSYLVQTAGILGDKLGPMLFQLPPYLRKDVPRMKEFLKLLPGELRAGFEFRHPSWYDHEVYDLLRSHDLALVVADTGSESDPPRQATAGYGYLRLRRAEYDASTLEDWARWVVEQSWSDAYAFFKHEDESAGPRLARQFSESLLRILGRRRTS